MIGEIERQFGAGWQSRISRSAREFHSVQFNLEPEEAAQVLAIEIDPDDLAAKGRERDPHVTVRFGFHEEVTPKDVEEIADGFIPVVATISDYEKFPEGPDGEPLVIRVNSPALVRLNEKLSVLPATDTWPTYKPHITVAYLKPGRAQAYLDEGNPLAGEVIELRDLVFSSNEKKVIPLLRYSPDQPRDDHGRWSAGDSNYFDGDGWLKSNGEFVSKQGMMTHGDAAKVLKLGGATMTDDYEVAAAKAMKAGNVRVAQDLTDENHFWFHGYNDDAPTRELIAKALEGSTGVETVGVEFDYPRDDSRIEWDDVSKDTAISLLHNHTAPSTVAQWHRALRYSPDQPRDEQGRWTDGGGEAFVSPNVSENLSLKEAIGKLNSEEQVNFLGRANELAGKLGGAHVVATIGDWRDGAENSTMLDFHHGTSEQLDYAAAKLGMEANQKQVLSFTRGHDGPDSIWNLTIPGTVDSVRQSLDAHGIDFRTLTIMPDKVGVTIFDQGTTLTDNVLGVAHDHQIDVERQRGSGKFLGGDTREAGRQVFAGIVDAYEKKHGVRSHHQGTRRPGRRGIGRSSEAQEVIQSKISVRLSDPVLRNYGAGWRARVSEEADT